MRGFSAGRLALSGPRDVHRLRLVRRRPALRNAYLSAGRFERLGRFSRLQPNRNYCTPHFEHSVLRHLAKRWPLEFRLDYEPAASV